MEATHCPPSNSTYRAVVYPQRRLPVLKIASDNDCASPYFSADALAMEFANLRRFAHQHCRFKLRNGKEIFGVVWEVETSETANADGTKRLFFASVRDYERLATGGPIQVMPIAPSEIVAVESLAS